MQMQAFTTPIGGAAHVLNVVHAQLDPPQGFEVQLIAEEIVDATKWPGIVDGGLD